MVPTPSGAPFTQAMARDLATQPHLVFACGRYEGIDQRVLDHAASRARVVEVSLGDYVLNGGEVAALAVTEAVVRLIPGFMGNAESLVEESHEDGLLEYPIYTKPASWRGLDVPPVLLSGDHGRIAEWRRAQALERTAARRPDLIAAREESWHIEPAARADAGELLTLQRACWLQEAAANDSVSGIPALQETPADVEGWIEEWDTWVLRSAGRLIGAARGRLEGDAWDIGRIMVAPDKQGQGLGRVLLEHIQEVAHAGRDVVRALHRSAEPRQHPDVHQGRVPAPPRPRGSAAGRRPDEGPTTAAMSAMFRSVATGHVDRA